MRLLENDKFLNLQSGKKYAYLEAYMSGPAKERIVTFQRHKIMLI